MEAHIEKPAEKAAPPAEPTKEAPKPEADAPKPPPPAAVVVKPPADLAPQAVAPQVAAIAPAPEKPTPEPQPAPSRIEQPASWSNPPDPNPGGLTEAQARRADLIWAAGILFAVASVFGVIRYVSGAAVPVLVALAIAYGLDPAADWLERKGLSRTSAVLVLFAAITLAIVGALLYLVPAIGAELAKLPTFFRDIAQKAIPRIEALIGRPLPADVRSAAEEFSQQGKGLAEKALPSVVAFAMGAVSSTANAVVFAFGLLVIPVLAFHLLHDYDRFVESARGLIPRRIEPLVARRFAEVNAVLGGFLRGQLTVGAILTVVYGVGLSIAGIDLAFVIGAVAGFGTMIPYVGPAVGMGLALLSLAVSWQGPWQLVVTAATFAIGMTAEGLYITPRVVGGKVGLSALLVMIAILGFASLFGFTGVLLAVPVTAALKVALRVALYRYRRTKLYTGSP